MLTIYFVPSGETDLSPSEELLGLNNPALNERGLLYAENIAERMRATVFEAVFSGPSKRDLVTARRIAKPHEMPVRIEKRLKDANYGSWSGMTWDEIAGGDPKLMTKLRKKPSRFRFPHGEKLKRVWKRVVIFSTFLRANFGTGYLVIVAGDFISAIIVSQMTGLRFEELEPWRHSKGEITVVECDHEVCRLKSLRGEQRSPALSRGSGSTVLGSGWGYRP